MQNPTNYNETTQGRLGKRETMILVIAVLAGFGHLAWVVSTLADSQSAALVRDQHDTSQPS